MATGDQRRRDAEKEVIARCKRAMLARDLPATAADVGRRLGVEPDTVRKLFNGSRSLSPEFVRDLGKLAGEPVAELYRMLGWIPAEDILPVTTGGVIHAAETLLHDLARMRPLLEGIVQQDQPAPLTAVRALIDDTEAAERFTTEIKQVVSGDRYRAVTHVAAEFVPTPDTAPLPYQDAEQLAKAAGLEWRPDAHDLSAHYDHATLALELRARTYRALRNGDECSWQGGPEHRTWRRVAGRWPTHLLVQDRIAGAQRAGGSLGVVDEDPRAIIVIGGRHGVSLAAGILAEALGRQFVLVRPDLDVTGEGHVLAAPAGSARTRVAAWRAVAEHIARTARNGTPWRPVVLVRPTGLAADNATTLDRTAARLLRETPARIVYARTPAAYLNWWRERTAGNFCPGGYEGDAWLTRIKSLYGEVESVLAARASRHDILLHIPDPSGDLAGYDPAIPGEVMDFSARVAWTVAGGLPGSSGGSPLSRLRPGLLNGWSAALSADPDARVSRLTDLRKA